MKIAIIVTLFPPRWLAGTEIATYHMAEHLAQRGHEVHVITSLDEGLPEERYENGFSIHRSTWFRVRFVGMFIYWVEILRTIQKIDPDIVHAQSLNLSGPAFFSKKILNIPYVVWGQGSDVYSPDTFTGLVSKTILKNADTVIALTDDMKRAMQNMYSREVVVVPNGIKLRDYIDDKTPVQKAEGSEKKILFVGRLHPVKGVRYLLQAMKMVHEKVPDAKAILVGDGEERKYLEDLTDRLGIKECVEFTGSVSHERVLDYMNQAGVFVLPSISEGFPVTILEAMACGLPIVATKVGGIPEIIDEEINGYLVEAKNPNEIADRLVMITENCAIREEMSSKNREKARLFTWDLVAAKLEQIYNDTIVR